MLLFWCSPVVSKLRSTKPCRVTDPELVQGLHQAADSEPTWSDVFCPSATGLDMLEVYPCTWWVLFLLNSSTQTKIKADLATAYPVHSCPQRDVALSVFSKDLTLRHSPGERSIELVEKKLNLLPEQSKEVWPSFHEVGRDSEHPMMAALGCGT